MYRNYFGLLRKPFELNPDTSTFFQSEMHGQVLSGLRQDMAEDVPFLLLTGGEGSGKTSLLKVLTSSLQIQGHLCVISDPMLKSVDFFAYLGAQFGLPFNGNKAKFLVIFANLLEECRENRKKILLIIDEAHILSIGLLEELRLLANLATQVKSVLTILLAGQPELLGRLTREQLFLLNQRIAVRYHLGNLTGAECRQYILFRLSQAGAGNDEVFADNALNLIYEATGGNPRQINLLCDNALLAAYLQGVPVIDEEVVRECVERLNIRGQDDFLLLPPGKSGMRRGLVWTVLAVLFLEGAGMVYVYQKGWLVPICQYLMRSIKLG